MDLTRPAAPGDRFVNEQNVGQLLVIEVLEPAYNVQTENGPADCIRANVYMITPAGAIGASYMGTLVFGKMLFSRLVQSVGKAVVGILTGQPGVKVAGKNVPYDLEDPSDAMMAAAQRAMLTRAQPVVQQPATAQAGPWGAPPPQQGPPPGWGQPPAQPAQAGPPPGWGQPAPQQGPPPGWGQPPVQQPAAAPAAGPWGQAPAPDQQWGQQQLPTPQQPAPAGPWGSPPVPTQEERPPWEQEPQQPAGAPPWGGQQ
jgi:hypothetical protein